MKKRLPALCLAALLVLSCLAFAACGSSSGKKKSKFVHSETFEGSLCEETYESEDEAVAAFLETEVSGATVTAELVKVEEKAKLTDKQVEELAIPAADKKKIKSVREVVVKYRDRKTSTSGSLNALPGFGFGSGDKDTSGDKEPSKDPSTDQDEEGTYSQRMYLCEYKDGSYKYFVPMLTNGEKLTKSYFDSVMNAEQYANCTFDFKLTADIKKSGKTDYNMDWKANVKFTEEVIYEHDDQKVTSSMTGGKSVTIVQDIYFKENDGMIGSVTTQKASGMTVADKEYSKLTNGDFTFVMERVLAGWFGADVDYTYFEKSDVGFALRSDKMQEFAEYLAKNDCQKYQYNYYYVKNLRNYTAEYTIFVTEGRIYECSCKYSYEADYQSEPLSVKGSYVIDLSDFAKTTCKVPADVDAVFAENF